MTTRDTRDTRDEQLSDEEWESALVRVVILNQEGKRQLRADRRALKDEIERLKGMEWAKQQMLESCHENYSAAMERAEKAERALAEASFAPMGDNHHNAVACPYCSAHVKEGEDV